MFEKVKWRIIIIAMVLFISIALFNILIIKPTKNVLDSQGNKVLFTNPTTYPLTKQLEPLKEKNWMYDIIFLVGGIGSILVFIYGYEGFDKPRMRSVIDVLADVRDNIADPFEVPRFDGETILSENIMGWRRMYKYYLVKTKNKIGKISWWCLYGMSDVGRGNAPEQVVDSYWNNDDIHQKYMWTFLHKEKSKSDVDRNLEKIKKYDLEKLKEKKEQQAVEEGEGDEEYD